MYTMTHDGKTLFDPRLDDYPVLAPKLQQEANKLASCTFTVFPDHPEYGLIRKLASEISLYRDNALMMVLRPVYSKRLFKGGVEYKCEECLARLNDLKVRPYSFQETISGYIDFVLESYNLRVPNDRKILRGTIHHPKLHDVVTFESKANEGHWDALQKHVVAEYGGYIVGRYTANGVYLDYLQEEDLPLSGQTIRFGENLADLFIEVDAASSFSVLIPTGADIKVTDSSGRQTTVRVDIREVNNNIDYIENAAGIALYGKREAEMRWPDITSPLELLDTARAYLDENAVKFAESVQLSAFDLHNADVDIPAFSLLQRVPVESAAHGLSETYVLSAITVPLGAPGKSSIQLGGKRMALTDRINSDSEQAQNTAVLMGSAIEAVDDASRSDYAVAQTDIGEQAQRLQYLFGEDDNCLFKMIYAEEEGQKNTLKLNADWKLNAATS